MAVPNRKALTLRCAGCGTMQDAACDCGVGYLSAKEYAAKFVVENPQMSDRAIAAEIGVSGPTVAKARKATANKFAVEAERPEDRPITLRIGRDGKARKLPKRKPKLRLVAPERMPTQQEADEEWQRDLHRQCAGYIKHMWPETRRKFFAQLKTEYPDEL